MKTVSDHGHIRKLFTTLADYKIPILVQGEAPSPTSGEIIVLSVKEHDQPVVIETSFQLIAPLEVSAAVDWEFERFSFETILTPTYDAVEMDWPVSMISRRLRRTARLDNPAPDLVDKNHIYILNFNILGLGMLVPCKWDIFVGQLVRLKLGFPSEIEPGNTLDVEFTLKLVRSLPHSVTHHMIGGEFVDPTPEDHMILYQAVLKRKNELLFEDEPDEPIVVHSLTPM